MTASTQTAAAEAATGPEPTLVEVAGEPATLRRSGSGRTVVYLHGAFFPTMWTPLHHALAERVDLVAPLHPGYAEGAPPDWLRGFDDLVLHHRALLDALGLDRVDLVGHGLGAWIAAQVAVHHPDRIRSLTALSPMGLRIPEAPVFEFLASDPARVAAAVFNGDTEGREHLFPGPDDIDAFVRAYGENGVTARLVWERRYDTGLDRRLALIDRPALVVTPADDRIVPVVHAQRWAELLPQGRLVTVDGPGHGAPLTHPAPIADAVSAFLEEVPA